MTAEQMIALREDFEITKYLSLIMSEHMLNGILKMRCWVYCSALIFITVVEVCKKLF